MSNEQTASVARPCNQRETVYLEMMRVFETSSGMELDGDLRDVAWEMFAISLGRMDGDKWKFCDRWGSLTPGEHSQDGDPEYPPPVDDISPEAQEKFRKHMRHVTRCMGIEAKIDAGGASLSPEMLRTIIRTVMERSNGNSCRPMKPSPEHGGRCMPVPTFAAVSPDVCNGIV